MPPPPCREGTENTHSTLTVETTTHEKPRPKNKRPASKGKKFPQAGSRDEGYETDKGGNDENETENLDKLIAEEKRVADAERTAKAERAAEAERVAKGERAAEAERVAKADRAAAAERLDAKKLANQKLIDDAASLAAEKLAKQERIDDARLAVEKEKAKIAKTFKNINGYLDPVHPDDNQMCGKRALNNIFQRNVVTNDMIDEVVNKLREDLREALGDASEFEDTFGESKTGLLDLNTMTALINKLGGEIVHWEQASKDGSTLQTENALLCNGGAHWFAFVKLQGKWWRLDDARAPEVWSVSELEQEMGRLKGGVMVVKPPTETPAD